ncbi:protein of unknown function [Saccharicrinis carchari]|uniref:DUF5009 domain-containing protein n=1 Tax=Saccharicrinis carchari TaxID=1168039 RepID=A0A521F6L0_SACCC|nr:DUF5009 domain-containing protein [Saccharicrinis carchari]SMO91736.1 protein of unknown function [Saccharicrinis carchari]
MNGNREISIDALRGLAIIGMILSGTIAQLPEMPAWMYHAQVGPVDFKFNPETPGISWVDLVFPFFLFAMGLSFPFSMNRFLENGGKTASLVRKVSFRAFNLFLFAIMLPHLSPYGLPDSAGPWRYLFTLAGFVGFFLTFSRFPKWENHELKLNTLGYLVLMTLLAIRWFAFGLPFSIHKNDIIILVLANMALVGALIWFITRHSWWPRLAVLTFYFGLRLTADLNYSINYEIFHFTPIKSIGNWIPQLKNMLEGMGVLTDRTIYFSMNFLKYLFIVIPGSIIGDLLYRQSQKKPKKDSSKVDNRFYLSFLAGILFLFTVVNLIGFFTRNSYIIYLGNIVLLITGEWFIHQFGIHTSSFMRKSLNWSYFWLFLGLIFEPYEGGIKKDVATMSYFFVTSGLAGLLLLSLKIWFESYPFSRIMAFLPKVGQNPMLGYVAVTYLIVPILGLTGLLAYLNQWSLTGVLPGLMKGVALTSLMIIVTYYSVKIKYFWKT